MSYNLVGLSTLQVLGASVITRKLINLITTSLTKNYAWEIFITIYFNILTKFKVIICWSTFGILVWNDSGYVNLTQWWYFFSLFLSIFYISQRLTLWYFVFLYLIFLSQQVLYFLLSTLVLTLFIDVVLSLSICKNSSGTGPTGPFQQADPILQIMKLKQNADAHRCENVLAPFGEKQHSAAYYIFHPLTVQKLFCSKSLE